MSVSRLRGKTPTIAQPSDRRPANVPPFWELEDLIAAGLAREDALRIMAARRTALIVIDGAEAQEAPPPKLAF